MKTIRGDLITLAKSGEFDVIVHGCNCFCTMGRGIALQIKKEFPEAYIADCETIKGDAFKLGVISTSVIYRYQEPFVVVNAYTQYDFRGPNQNADYQAIRNAFRLIKERFSGKSIAYPKIGAGLARGDWNVISKIIDEELVGEDHTLVEWER